MKEISLKGAKRILVMGSPGSGKSTLARELARVTKLPLVHLDKLFWRPGWVHCSREEFDALLALELKKEEWIIDGNYSRTVAERLKYADTVIFFDYPVWLCLWRVIKRYIQSKDMVRPDMGDGCPERLDFDFLKYVRDFRKKELPGTMLKLKGEHKAHVIYIRNKKDFKKLKNSIKGML